MGATRACGYFWDFFFLLFFWLVVKMVFRIVNEAECDGNFRAQVWAKMLIVAFLFSRVCGVVSGAVIRRDFFFFF